MSQMNPSVDNSMRNHNPWLTSNSVGIQTWLNGPQIPVVSVFHEINLRNFYYSQCKEHLFQNKFVKM